METWKLIKDYETYSVSNLGNVKRSNKYLKLNNNKGYKQVGLSKNNIKVQHRVHRLVAQTFIPNVENKPLVNHINGIKSDNRVENLEWASYQENNNHYIKNIYNRKKNILIIYDKETGEVIHEIDMKGKAFKLSKF